MKNNALYYIEHLHLLAKSLTSPSRRRFYYDLIVDLIEMQTKIERLEATHAPPHLRHPANLPDPVRAAPHVLSLSAHRPQPAKKKTRSIGQRS